MENDKKTPTPACDETAGGKTASTKNEEVSLKDILEIRKKDLDDRRRKKLKKAEKGWHKPK